MNQSLKTSRGVSVSILSEILENGAYANIALRKFLPQTKLDSRDRAFVTELVNETLRNLLSIDYVINHFSKLPVSKMKPFIRNLLRVSVCQLRHMDKVPQSAAVNEAVTLAKSHGFGGISGFVNGVLRAIAHSPLDPPLPDCGSADYLSRRYSYPSWLADALVKWLGTDEANKFCENSHLPPPVTVFVNTLKTTQDGLHKRLRAEGLDSTFLGDEFLILHQAGDISGLPAFKEGLFFVMDPGAIWAVKALALKPGQTVIDLCAAPGGKSFAAACQMGDTGQINAFDIHPHRVSLIHESIKRLGLTSIQTNTKDATTYDTAFDSIADAVLIDAPCTGFGTISKRPEIKYNRSPQDIETLAEVQKQMLSTGARYVKKGGILVYSTCTVAREENIENIRWFLNDHPFKLCQPLLPPPDISFLLEDNCLQIMPGMSNDGFFITSMIKF